MSLAASIPLRVGSPKSRRMMSGCNAVAFWTASGPSHASDTIVHSGRACKISRIWDRQGSKSSTTRILAFGKIGSTIIFWAQLANERYHDQDESLGQGFPLFFFGNH